MYIGSLCLTTFPFLSHWLLKTPYQLAGEEFLVLKSKKLTIHMVFIQHLSGFSGMPLCQWDCSGWKLLTGAANIHHKVNCEFCLKLDFRFHFYCIFLQFSMTEIRHLKHVLRDYIDEPKWLSRQGDFIMQSEPIFFTNHLQTVIDFYRS